MAALISIQDLYFQYPTTSQTAQFSMDVPSFQMLESEQWVVTGPSGSGKSTLLNLIAGELTATAGQVVVLGEDLGSLSVEERQNFRIQNIGFVFQDFPLVPYLSALENVLFPFYINPTITLTKGVRSFTEDLFAQVGLQERRAALPHQLSQGERQRVAIARALVVKPKLILADEPTAGLDIERSHSVMNLIDDIVGMSKVGMLLVTHEPQMIERYVNRYDVQGGV